ncbi:HD-GYP domain-containing protein [Clostridiaceae bacterium HSG29]|nr:HD-GYP domain-containing protein [Clostridiaceae bacterium HSG29]
MEVSKESFIIVFRKENIIIGGILLEIKMNSKKSFTKESERLMFALKNIAESYLLNESYYKINEIFKNEIVYSMIQMVEIHDIYTKGHSESVANYSKDLAEYIGMSDEKVNEIYWAGIVHDVGKILIDRSIINKEGRLTDKEYEIMKKHPEFGYQALSKSKLTKNVANYVLYHHERIDGKGYPEGLKGDEIPIESKIISIADSYDAMISERTYKKKMSKEKALKEIKNNLNLQFDVELGLKFIEMMEKR